MVTSAQIKLAHDELYDPLISSQGAGLQRVEAALLKIIADQGPGSGGPGGSTPPSAITEGINNAALNAALLQLATEIGLSTDTATPVSNDSQASIKGLLRRVLDKNDDIISGNATTTSTLNTLIHDDLLNLLDALADPATNTTLSQINSTLSTGVVHQDLQAILTELQAATTVDNGSPITGESIPSGSGPIGWLSSLRQRSDLFNSAIGNPVDAAATDDTGAFSLLSLTKRVLQNLSVLLSRTPTLVGGRLPVDGSGVTQPIQIAGNLPPFESTPNVTLSGSLPAFATTPTVTVGNSSVPVTGDFYPATQAISIDQSGVSNRVAATQSGAWNIGDITGSIPLGLGASTSANQVEIRDRLGGLAEPTPATDTGSSGLNGRLQRVAQNLTAVGTLLTNGASQFALRSSAKGASLSGAITSTNLSANKEALDVLDGADVVRSAGAGPRTALGDNILLPGGGTAWTDLSAVGPKTCGHFSVKLVGAASVTAGQVIFEGAEDPLGGGANTLSHETGIAVFSSAAIPIPSSSIAIFHVFNPGFRFVRCRISTAFTGTTPGVTASEITYRPIAFPSGTTRVNIANTTIPTSVSGNVSVVGAVAHSSTDAGGPVKTGGRVRTVQDTTLVNNDRSDTIMTTSGATVIHPYAVPELCWSQSALNGGASNSVQGLPGLGLSTYITGISWSAVGAIASQTITLNSGGPRWQITTNGVANDRGSEQFAVPIKCPANTSLTIDFSVGAAGSFRYNLQGFTAP
jgi:hypothetical protein